MGAISGQEPVTALVAFEGNRYSVAPGHAGATVEVSPRQLVRDDVTVLGSRYASRWEVSHAANPAGHRRVHAVVVARRQIVAPVPLVRARSELHDVKPGS